MLPISYNPTNFDQLCQFADKFSRSKLIPSSYQGCPQDIVLCAIAGQELGMSLMQSLQNIAIINGKASIYGDALIAIIRSSDVCEYIKESFDKETMTATCEAKRKSQEAPVIFNFSKEDAETASLWNKKGPWTTYPKRMLQMRARGFALRDAFADLLCGMITSEEAQDYPVKDITPEPPRYEDVLAAMRAAKTEEELMDAAIKARGIEGEDRDRLKVQFANFMAAIKHQMMLQEVRDVSEMASGEILI